jgi:hypothetical protein
MLRMRPEENTKLLKNAQMVLCVNFSSQTTTRITEVTTQTNYTPLPSLPTPFPANATSINTHTAPISDAKNVVADHHHNLSQPLNCPQHLANAATVYQGDP